MLSSCGQDGNRFRLKGEFRNLNQGEFYIYSPDGVISGVDTVKFDRGRFSYETECEDEGALVIIFPNYSRQVVFAAPGRKASLKADASHLKEMEVTGTEANEEMTAFRHKAATSSPPEVRKQAAAFVEQHPESPVCAYLIRQYFVQTASPDYAEAYRLAGVAVKAQPDNGALHRLRRQIEPLKNTAIGQRLPAITAYDTQGRLVSGTSLQAAPVTVVSTCAAWNFESREMQRTLARYRRQSGGKLALISISLDANPKTCTETMQKDSVTWQVICDGTMFDNKTLRTLGLGFVPDNLLLDHGRIVRRSLSVKEMKEELGKRL